MALYPKRKPYRKGFFSVSGGHKLYFACYGNRSGVPVLFVHGGPGAGCGDNAYRYFEPKRFNILLLDQRGAGKSVPFASTKSNTTNDLIEDIRAFLQFLKIRRTFLFGGSWGACLSLCYAERYTETVLGMVLRGIFLGTGFDDDYMLKGHPKTHFPEVWDRFVSFVPKNYAKNATRFYAKMMNSKDPKVVRKYCREWALFESSLLKLEYDPVEVRKKTRGRWVVALAKLEAHYLGNNCFLKKNQILKNASKIRNIPCSIVHGRYDFVCPPEGAYLLHKVLPRSKLHFVTAGHSSSDAQIQSTMMREIKNMEKNLRKH